jgi:thermostable 8-oxoguanine DNA glycosylase
MGHEVPKTTPQGQKYIDLEKIFLAYCVQYGKTPAAFDLEIWNKQH